MTCEYKSITGVCHVEKGDFCYDCRNSLSHHPMMEVMQCALGPNVKAIVDTPTTPTTHNNSLLSMKHFGPN
jgi:hypothetical protein